MPVRVAGAPFLEVVAVLRFDPFRDIDRFAEQVLAAPGQNRVPRFMPMDLFKAEDRAGWKGGFDLVYALVCRSRGKFGRYADLTEQ